MATLIIEYWRTTSPLILHIPFWHLPCPNCRLRAYMLVLHFLKLSSTCCCHTSCPNLDLLLEVPCLLFLTIRIRAVYCQALLPISSLQASWTLASLCHVVQAPFLFRHLQAYKWPPAPHRPLPSESPSFPPTPLSLIDQRSLLSSSPFVFSFLPLLLLLTNEKLLPGLPNHQTSMTRKNKKLKQKQDRRTPHV